MNILELDSFNLADAVKFNDQLNPRIWDGNKMRPEVREKLLAIAADFQESLGVSGLDVEDITVSGSNAGYTYTPHSDIDLHLVVLMPEECDDVYQELFNAKKYQYNDEHDIRIGGYDVELYVQPADQPHVSAGVYSVAKDDWIHIPRKIAARVDDESVRNKYEDIKARIESALKSSDTDRLRKLWDKIKEMRRSGLAQNGELGAENLAFKMLRTQGDLGRLRDAIARARDAELSLIERRKKKKKSRVKYGFGGYWYPGFAFSSGEGNEGGGGGGGGESVREVALTPDGVSPSTKMFLSEKDIPSHTEIIFDFMRFAVHELGLNNVPVLKIKKDPQWSAIHKSFGRYRNDLGQIELAVGNRHIMDVLRTLAHELQHRKQDEREHMPDDAGETGSRFENEAHAVAGILMRRYADMHPEYFEDVPMSESASGYIPKNKKEAQDPRYAMAVTVDIKPGQTGKEANKMALKTDSQGQPALLMKTVNLRENTNSPASSPGVIFLNNKTAIVGQHHGQPLQLQPETLKRVQAIAAQHGAWYEGNGTDRAYTKGQINQYQGSWDDLVAKTASPNDPKWLYVLFSNVDANNRVQRVGINPKDTIFNQLLKTNAENSYQGIGFGAAALKKFLIMASQGNYDFVKMSQQPATEQNLTQFLKAGESLMWPSNWSVYPNRAGKIAKAATVDVRDQFLASRTAGVYVTGIGHLRAVQQLANQTPVAEDDLVKSLRTDPTYNVDETGKDLTELALKSTLPVTQTMDHPNKQIYHMKTQSGEYQIVFHIFNKDDAEDDGPTGYLLDILLLGRNPNGTWTQQNTNVGEKQVAQIFATIAQLAVKIIKTHPNIDEIEIRGADPQRSRIYSRLMQQNIDSMLPGWKLGGAGLIKQNVATEQDIPEGKVYNIAPDQLIDVVYNPSRIDKTVEPVKVATIPYQNLERLAALLKQKHGIEDTDLRWSLAKPTGAQNLEEQSDQQYLWHGSRQKIAVLEPRQARDIGGAAGSNKNAIYATSDPKIAIAMGLTTPGSDTGMFPNDPQMVLFSGNIRKGENVYLHKLPVNGPDGRPQFVQGGNSREFYSVPEVKGIKPIEIKTVPVDQYLHLIRPATPQDLELRKKYSKQDVTEDDLVESLRQEFALLEDEYLSEIRMSTANLRQEAAKTGAIAGMEFEMIVPNVQGEPPEPEYERDDDRDTRARSFDDIEDFFYDGDYNGRGQVRSLMNSLGEAYQEWKYERISDDWTSEGFDYFRDYIENNDLFDRDEALETARDEFVDANPDIPVDSEEAQQAISARIDELEQEFVEAEFEAQGNIYNDAFEEFSQERNQDISESDFLEENYPYMSDIERGFDIQWPYYYDINADQDRETDIDTVADEFQQAIGRPVNASSSYHGARREAGHYVVEPDGSLDPDDADDAGLEFVSPPLPIDELLSDLNKVKQWAGMRGCYTNNSTGLHINISVPGYSLDKLDYVKLALMMGDEYVLDQFGRMSNTYTKAATGKIRNALKRNPDLAPEIMDKMRGHMQDLATKAIHSGATEKYTSINTKTGYIEFRSPGGDWLDANFDKIENTLLRFVVAMDAALDPEKYRKEYLKKLYKLLESTQDKEGVDVIELFTNYSAGELDKAALIRQVREKQLARNLAKGRTPPGQKYWWSVERPGYFASVEVVAQSREEAIKKGLAEYPDWANARDVTARPLRPYQEPAQPRTEPTVYGRPSNPDGNFVIVSNISRAPVYRFMAAHAYDADTVALQWSRENPGDWVVRYDPDQSLGQPPVPGSTMDRQIRRAAQQPTQASSTQQSSDPGSLIDQGIAASGTFTGNWLIQDENGRTIHRFGGIGNSQGDANNFAIRWLQQNPQHMQAGVTVSPEMS